ncbi:LysR family transcriptional regulator [Subtercola endophyticus]|uniref:LysR family transcriptional regulator n=1 Tax=Subtercola endophyticus TaxID=2895559 RepID=UPI001E4AAF0A|nr:LysR family transcriptional regulator [Subtercola endophyticus]UFS60598.1 LysR family transcriptional regulator [Subtercola endophyticus]
MDLRGLEAVVAVNECGSFSAAALALYISQPALTRRVALLERELHSKLFTRTARGVFLTEAGKAIIEPAERALRDAQDVLLALNPARDRPPALLRLNAATNSGMERIGRLIARFHDGRPLVDVEFAASESTAAAVTALEDGRCDLAVVDQPIRSQSLTVTNLFQDDYLAVFAPAAGVDVAAGRMHRLTTSALQGRSLVHLPESLHPQQPGKQLFEMLGTQPASTIQTHHPELMVSIALAGRAVAVVPRNVAMAALAAGACVAEPPRPITRVIGLASNRSEQSIAASLFLRLAVSEFPGVNQLEMPGHARQPQTDGPARTTGTRQHSGNNI